ncbi:hypothetical protein GCM10007938_39740 [Vibrio zhanjiangensis]|uniref:HTH cro/C1-type domain-containing protein n=1 Tax=Vibrio zhanjiangensis TaxID=1046128 RepID=A0ABQ6F5V2_9VIBR|nr:helix-turn-helix transcriptional regulator [Vibrio zhanjiangensis]GLT20191.1 hypothetical protein GCM10007938_39740 [Vibrio zhanjiangensis]
MLLNLRDKIRLHIDGSGQSDSEIARKIGVSRVSVGRWKKTGQITRENLVKLCSILGVSERDFYSDEISSEMPLKKINIIKKIADLDYNQLDLIKRIEDLLE